MKKLFVVLCVLMVIVVAAANAGSGDYTVRVPAGWEKVKGSAAPEHYMKSGVSFILTIDTAPATAKTPDQFVEYVKKQFAGTFKNTKFEPVRKVTINGREGRELVYTGEMSGMKMKYDVVYIPKDGKYYTLTIGGLEMTFDTVKADVSAIVNSFTLK